MMAPLRWCLIVSEEEPVYEFVKGKGWIINPGVIVTRQNKTYRVEMRVPNPGELCCWDYTSNGYSPEKWAEWFRKTHHTCDYESLQHDLTKANIQWVTFVEIE